MNKRDIEAIRKSYIKLMCNGDHVSPAANALISYIPMLVDEIKRL